MIENNPTRTKTIQNNWFREINRRWSKFKKVTIDELYTYRTTVNNALGFEFDMNASQQRTYMAFLQAQINEILLGGGEGLDWQNYYQAQAYQRGIEATRKSLISMGASLAPTADELLRASGLTTFTATASLGSISTAPIHADALEFLFGRSIERLKGWTDAMATQTRQILHDGITNGEGIAEISRKMVDRQNVSRSRARVIARTETIQAYQVSNANEAERAGEEIGEEVKMRWLSGLGPSVRHLHATWHGTITSISEYRRRIQVSPWNCVCGAQEVLEEFITPAKQEKFKKEREVLLAKEKNRK